MLSQVLRYEGSIKHFRQALRELKPATRQAGTLAADELNHRRFQRRLREAEIASIREQILTGGGDAA